MSVAVNAECRRQKAETWRIRIISAFCILLSAFIAQTMQGCPVCFGAPGPSQDGLNGAILFLLAIVGLVQAGFIALFWSFRRRAKELERFRDKFHVIEGGV